jgi:DNA repair exonuclease SbcCD ATPase subunit
MQNFRPEIRSIGKIIIGFAAGTVVGVAVDKLFRHFFQSAPNIQAESSSKELPKDEKNTNRLTKLQEELKQSQTAHALSQEAIATNIKTIQELQQELSTKEKNVIELEEKIQKTEHFIASMTQKVHEANDSQVAEDVSSSINDFVKKYIKIKPSLKALEKFVDILNNPKKGQIFQTINDMEETLRSEKLDELLSALQSMPTETTAEKLQKNMQQLEENNKTLRKINAQLEFLCKHHKQSQNDVDSI